jgi:hypothetical protein
LSLSTLLDNKFKSLETTLLTTDLKRIKTSWGGPFVILLYPPERELDVRRRIAILANKLEADGQRVDFFEPGPILYQHLAVKGKCKEAFDAERHDHKNLRSKMAADLYVQRLSELDENADSSTVIFVKRSGGFYPHIAIHTLLDKLASRTKTLMVFFVPGEETKDPYYYLFLGIVQNQKYKGRYI